MAYDLAQMPIPFKAVLGAVTATTTRVIGQCKAPRGDIVGIDLLVDAAITGDATNRYTFVLKKGTISSPTTVATLDLVAGISPAANVPYAWTLPTGSAANDALRAILPTDVLHVVATKGGSGANIGWCEVLVSVAPTIDYANRVA